MINEQARRSQAVSRMFAGCLKADLLSSPPVESHNPERSKRRTASGEPRTDSLYTTTVQYRAVWLDRPDREHVAGAIGILFDGLMARKAEHDDASGAISPRQH